MTTIEALKKKHNRTTNVRKGLNALAFLAPMTTAVPTRSPTLAALSKEIPVRLHALVSSSTDGITLLADAKNEEVESPRIWRRRSGLT